MKRLYIYNHIQSFFYIFAVMIINFEAYEIPKYQESIGCMARAATIV